MALSIRAQRMRRNLCSSVVTYVGSALSRHEKTTPPLLCEWLKVLSGVPERLAHIECGHRQLQLTSVERIEENNRIDEV